jgi:hypothetical protein
MMLVLVLLLLLPGHVDASAAAFEQGAWWARLPLKATSTPPDDSSGDLNGTLAAIGRAKMTMVGVDAMGCGAAKLPGDTGTGGVGIEDFVRFLDAAAVQSPGLKVFAVTSSHHELFQYCHQYLNDNKTAVNWTRVGGVIAHRTAGRENFAGIYIDDFYVMMCRPEATSFKLHGAKAATPCVTMADLDKMRAAMHAVNPTLELLPLVYHSELMWAQNDSIVLGQAGGGKFVPPARASASLLLKQLPQRLSAGSASRRLRFYYNTRLSGWNNPRLIAAGQTVNGTIMFEASVNGHVILSVDAAAAHGVQVFDQDIGHVLPDQASTVSVTFATYPTAAAADSAHLWMQRDCYRTSYVFGVSLSGDGAIAPVLKIKYSATAGVRYALLLTCPCTTPFPTFYARTFAAH